MARLISPELPQTARLPKYTLILGIVCTVFFAVSTILLFISGKIAAAIALCLPALLGAALIMAYRNFKTSCFKNKITVTDFWGKKAEYRMDRIVGKRETGCALCLYVHYDGFETKELVFTKLGREYRELYLYICKKYESSFHREIPVYGSGK